MLYGYGCKSAATFNMLTHAAHTYKCHILHVVQGHRNTFYFSVTNFSYQNMDVARTLYTSAVKKLFDQEYSPCSPHSSYTYEWYIPDRMSTILLLYCRCFTVIYRYQLLPTCDGCHASYILSHCHCSLS